MKRYTNDYIAPNPGSDEAITQGCVCSALDNNHGRGIPYPRPDGKDPKAHPSFWVDTSCPLHARITRCG